MLLYVLNFIMLLEKTKLIVYVQNKIIDLMNMMNQIEYDQIDMNQIIIINI